MSEIVVVDRTGEAVHAWVDPDKHEVYVDDAAADLRAGDLLTLRGGTARVGAAPRVWAGAGIVAAFSDETVLTDQATVSRRTGGGFDRATRAYVEPTPTPVWSGPCLVEQVDQGGDLPDGEQVISTQHLRIKTPLSLVDARPDDIVTLTQASDPRLVGRPLVVLRIEGIEDGLRLIRVLDNQG